jgi:hypothetical protein
MGDENDHDTNGDLQLHRDDNEVTMDQFHPYLLTRHRSSHENTPTGESFTYSHATLHRNSVTINYNINGTTDPFSHESPHEFAHAPAPDSMSRLLLSRLSALVCDIIFSRFMMWFIIICGCTIFASFRFPLLTTVLSTIWPWVYRIVFSIEQGGGHSTNQLITPVSISITPFLYSPDETIAATGFLEELTYHVHTKLHPLSDWYMGEAHDLREKTPALVSRLQDIERDMNALLTKYEEILQIFEQEHNANFRGPINDHLCLLLSYVGLCTPRAKARDKLVIQWEMVHDEIRKYMGGLGILTNRLSNRKRASHGAEADGERSDLTSSLRVTIQASESIKMLANDHFRTIMGSAKLRILMELDGTLDAEDRKTVFAIASYASNLHAVFRRAQHQQRMVTKKVKILVNRLADVSLFAKEEYEGLRHLTSRDLTEIRLIASRNLLGGALAKWRQVNNELQQL